MSQFSAVQDVITAIRPNPGEDACRQAAHRQWASIAKPLGSLGMLETAVEDIAALTGSADVDISKRSLLLLCAEVLRALCDNGGCGAGNNRFKGRK